VALGAADLQRGSHGNHEKYNRAGLEIWDSTHLRDGNLRPELQGLSLEDLAATFVAHWPDLTPEEVVKLRFLLGP
jgi:hypothetical protein